ncbi:cell wall shape-determining protein [Salinisphaera orenii MK-B5]|uniref:Peptidoglycan glycosyltransferase MrdB n=1 Tax=Salinisphaera orenii MK-B5 TaxID=856730 RepID=A0A423PNL9_9GAMM|nr:rod shape-determining protein RodA [Salinisphaera orenii]ROO27152.1 cell wall shape-determining protein [Salinisphaera orenii MK-B5]
MTTQTAANAPSTLSEWLVYWRIDLQLLVALLCGGAVGLFVLYSASGQSTTLVLNQAIRFGIGILGMLIIAQIPPDWFRVGAPWLFALGVVLLTLVILIGDTAMGAQRWLDFGFMRFQPSEIMKLAAPLAIAAYFHDKSLPPTLARVAVAAAMIAVPAGLIANQPDLGTSLLISIAGAFAIYFAGLRWRVILVLALLAAAAAPLLWFNMHEYQQARVLTFLNPASDPTGAGYHISQSKIAIGSGGLFGKGWLNGSQAHLNFLPESDTDFVFAVFAEETGLFGVMALLALYCFIVARGLYIAAKSQDTFQRLAAGSLSLTFFIYVFVNIGMVAGLMPVVGVPLPLISYGGTSMVILLASFGILMSIHTHRKLLAT